MTSAVFETDRFRVHITGKAAWVEAKDGVNWVFCNWHALPASSDCSDSDALKAAVADYEEARGESSLRIALTGIGQVSRSTAIKQPIQAALKPSPKVAIAPARSKRIVSSAREKKASGYFGFRSPLRPPLLTPAVASLGPNVPNH
jgi:hypothetical protein